MGDMLKDGLTWLAEKLTADVSTSITYKRVENRRTTNSVTIQATYASQVLKVTDGQGNTKVERPDADFIFSAADLDFGDGPVEPQSSDIIVAVFGSTTKTFKLMPMGRESSWRYCDPHQLMIRVHCKLTQAVTE